MNSKLEFRFLFPSHLFPIQTAGFIARRKTPSHCYRTWGFLRKSIAKSAAETRMLLLSTLRAVRWVTLILGFSNLVVIVLVVVFMVAAFSGGCSGGQVLPFVVVALVAGIKIMSMIGTGIAQEATATTIASQQQARSSVVDAVIRHERRMRYKRWLWWTRFGTVITLLQFVGATYLMFMVVKYFSYDGKSDGCYLGKDTDTKEWKHNLLIFFLILVWLVVIIQCITGSDVLRWRSFYATHNDVWRAHYLEVFDYGLREALCCMGRVKYLSALEEDEVHSVARLLGDLVVYRASGTGHLELLAGLALLQNHRLSTNSREELMEAPESLIQEALIFHPFAEAAYTGPLLDVGRNPLFFPCAWLYRQGVLMPWSRNRRPVLEGDNWWRGHAAAFLTYVKLSPEALRRGRVNQAKREAAYFLVVLHHLRTVVIAVRGTETPEDLITDGLCRECLLLPEDVDGLIKKYNLNLCSCSNSGEHVPFEVRRSVLSSFPHYGHSGIVEAARELFLQIDGKPVGEDGLSSGATGYLSSLLGAGCECEGYNVRVVGHSLGGAIATMLGLRLYRQYPNLHVYAYGPLPCVDFAIAEACSSFVTSFVHNDEFSSRLSVSSILRLQAAAIAALSQDSSASSAMVCNFARRILNLNKLQENEENETASTPPIDGADATNDCTNHMYRRGYKYVIKGGICLCTHGIICMLNMPSHHPFSVVMDKKCKLSSDSTLETRGVSDKNSSAFTAGVGEPCQQLLNGEPTASFIGGTGSEILTEQFDSGENSFADISNDGLYRFNNDSHDPMALHIGPCFMTADDGISGGDSVSQLVDGVSTSVDVLNNEHPEMLLPGLVIHIVPEKKGSLLPLWGSWKDKGKHDSHRAYIASRENFKDLIVSPYMFLDHLPWRCRYAMKMVLEGIHAKHGQHNADDNQYNADLPNGSLVV